MSEYWSLYCVDCAEECDTPRLNHGEVALKQIWEMRDRIVAAGRIRDDCDSELEIKIQRYGEDLPVQFFVDHKDHNVQIKSEYGPFFGECAKLVACSTCGVRRHCTLSVGHGEPCKHEARK